ncbi:MAG: hypothetical protein QOD07_1026, partial [Frankiaceae bacterium]|nr:hypothetical protein [Frankiaceae bacterium]
MILTDSGTSTATTPLSWGQTLVGLAIVASAVLVAGLIVLLMRNT